MITPPFNETTGHTYAASPAARLRLRAIERGYDLTRGWATFAQWRGENNRIRKGQKGTAIWVDNPDLDNHIVLFHWSQTLHSVQPPVFEQPEDWEWETISLPEEEED